MPIAPPSEPRMRHIVPVVSLLAAALLAGCSSSERAPLVERTDSAGVTLLSNSGGARPLDWRFEPVLRLGGADEGPESFYRLHPALVGVDDAGRIHVLDAAAHRAVVFDSVGRHVRTFGSEGDGPGEMWWPAADLLIEEQGSGPLLPAISMGAIAPDGSIWVDRSRIKGEPRVIDLFDAEGVSQGTLPPDLPFPAAFTPAGDVVAIESDEMDVDRLVVYRIDRSGS